MAMDRTTYEFAKKASRTAYEEAIRTGDGGGSVENHTHLDYSKIDHHHDATYAKATHSHPSTSAPVVILTQEEYDALENKSEGTLYVVI